LNVGATHDGLGMGRRGDHGEGQGEEQQGQAAHQRLFPVEKPEA